MQMFIAPMLLESIEKPFSDDSYVFEPIDGHRIILSKQDNETRLWTRHRNECTRQYPELHHLPIRAKSVVLDGEVCCTDPESGNIDFELIMERFQIKKKEKIKSFSKHRPVTFVVWDILSLDGRDLRELPLVKRRSILESVIQPNEHISIVPQIEDRGEDLWEAVVSKSMEGMVAKKKNSHYVSRRSHEWLKVVNFQYTNVFLVGYRKDEFGWLAHVEENGKLRGAGIIELGVTGAHRKAFYNIVSTFKSSEDKNFVYLEPKIQASVKFRNWTRGGMLRTPSFVNFIV